MTKYICNIRSWYTAISHITSKNYILKAVKSIIKAEKDISEHEIIHFSVHDFPHEGQPHSMCIMQRFKCGLCTVILKLLGESHIYDEIT